jgi:urease accessory protein UreH
MRHNLLYKSWADWPGVYIDNLYLKFKEEEENERSWCLTKHHAMKTYWGSGGIAPRILDLGTGWR